MHDVTGDSNSSKGVCKQVLHGCRQLVSRDVGLSPATSATLTLSYEQVKLGILRELPVTNRRRSGMTSSPHGPYVPGSTRATMAGTKGVRDREVELIPESRSQFGLKSATRLHEAGIASNRGSACHGEYVPGPCTHRPSHHESRLYQKSLG